VHEYRAMICIDLIDEGTITYLPNISLGYVTPDVHNQPMPLHILLINLRQGFEEKILIN